MARLQGKVVLVTGAAGAIGQAIAWEIAKQGGSVALSDLDEVKGQEVVKGIQESGAKAVFHRVNVAKEDEVHKWVEDVVALWGKIDGLVNNAAAFVFGKIEDVTEEQWDKVLSVNVKGYAFTAKHASKHMKNQKSGSIVNIASISSFIAQPAFVPYNTSKGAIIQLTRCLAMDLGTFNIRANAICPGCIDTPATGLHAAKMGMSKEDLVAQMLKEHFVKRMGQPEDVAKGVTFLISDDSTFVTGTTLAIDGGYLAH